MRNINLRYVDETYDDNNVLTSYRLKYPDSYNFGYDVVDDIAIMIQAE
jgi:acetyl-CoA synthetase